MAKERKPRADMKETDFVGSKSRLSEVLSTSRITLDRWIALPDAPKRRPNGMFCVSEWVAFAATKKAGPTDEEDQSLKSEKLRIEVDRMRLNALREAQAVIPIEWATGMMDNLVIKTRRVIEEGVTDPTLMEMLLKEISEIRPNEYLAELQSQIAA